MTYPCAVAEAPLSFKTILFKADLAPVSPAFEDCLRHFPKPGWFRYVPQARFKTLVGNRRSAIDAAALAASTPAAVLISNLRETTRARDKGVTPLLDKTRHTTRPAGWKPAGLVPIGA